MADWQHQNVGGDDDNRQTIERNTRIGLILFTIYLALYSGYVLLSTFAPDVMKTTPLAGINLAIWYGFGLIIAALVMALIYGWLCRSRVEEH